MATDYAPSQNLGNLMSQLQQVGQQGQFNAPMKLPTPVVPDWMKAAQGASVAPTGLVGTGTSTGGYSSSGGGTDTLSRLYGAIRQQESHGNYSARNPTSGAAGAYQIMPSNIPSWSQEALGHVVSLDQFMNSRQIQDQIAQYKLAQYYKQYGDAGAAVAWYAGPTNVKNMYSTKTQTGGYPSLYAYWKSVLAKM